MGLVLLAEIIEISKFLTHQFGHVLAKGLSSLFEQSIHEINQLLLVLLVEVVLTNLNLLVFVESSLNLLGHVSCLSFVGVDVDLVASFVSELL